LTGLQDNQDRLMSDSEVGKNGLIDLAQGHKNPDRRAFRTLKLALKDCPIIGILRGVEKMRFYWRLQQEGLDNPKGKLHDVVKIIV